MMTTQIPIETLYSAQITLAYPIWTKKTEQVKIKQGDKQPSISAK